jgi:hypothetical protein
VHAILLRAHNNTFFLMPPVVSFYELTFNNYVLSSLVHKKCKPVQIVAVATRCICALQGNHIGRIFAYLRDSLLRAVF